MKYILSVLALVMTLAVASDAFAEGQRGKKSKMDLDGDGVVSRSEYTSARQKKMDEHFTQMDSNGDGNLTREEMKAGRKAMHQRMKERREKRKERRDSRQDAE